MIISASRRTDIPNYYSEWFFNRIHEGFVLVRNPMNYHQVSRIALTPDVVDGIVFWTKNPAAMLPRLGELSEYAYYFQFTVNGYDQQLERNIPSKESEIVPAFRQLSSLIGPERVIWRYDPVLIGDGYDIDYHVERFSRLAGLLEGFTEKCVFSYLDLYKSIKKSMNDLGIGEVEPEFQRAIAEALLPIASDHGMAMETCSEKIDLSDLGIRHGHCVDAKLFERLLGAPLDVSKDKNQRLECGCVASIDIGSYGTCRNGCRYCYANHSEKLVQRNSCNHDPDSPLLVGHVEPDDKITDRKVGSCLLAQFTLDLFPADAGAQS